MEKVVAQQNKKRGDEETEFMKKEDTLKRTATDLNDQIDLLNRMLEDSNAECSKFHNLYQRILKEYNELEVKNSQLVSSLQDAQMRAAAEQNKQQREVSERHKTVHHEEKLLDDGAVEISEINYSRQEIQELKKEINKMYRQLGLPNLVIPK